MFSARATARMRASGPDQHRNDQSALRRLDRTQQRVAVARMDDGAGDRRQRLALLEKLRESVVAAQDELWRRDVRIRDALGRRLHHRHAVDKRRAVLIRAGAGEIDRVRAFVSRLRRDRRRQRVADMAGAGVAERGADDRAAGTRQAAIEESRHQRNGGGPLRRNPVIGAAAFEMKALDVARGERQRLDVGGRQRAADRLGRADLDLVERAVGQL